MTHAHAHIGGQGYQVAIEASGHSLMADEPVKLGGTNAGPAPYDLLLSALGACTAITLRMVADRHQWPIETLDVGLRIVDVSGTKHIKRTLTIVGPDDAARVRLADAAERTPVTLTIKNGMPIDTRLEDPSDD